jgi:hypothetical protein
MKSTLLKLLSFLRDRLSERATLQALSLILSLGAAQAARLDAYAAITIAVIGLITICLTPEAK